MKLEDLFRWIDGMYIDEANAWYITGHGNILNCFDLNTSQIVFSKLLPNSNMSQTRLNSICIKCSHYILCAPCYATDFWIYDIQKDVFERLDLEMRDVVHPVIWNMYTKGNRLFAISKTGKEVIEIDLKEWKVERRYSIAGADEQLGNSEVVGDSIYSLLTGAGTRVSKFNMVTKECKYYQFPQIEHPVNTVCFDGVRFWFSGCEKYIYLWRPTENQVELLDCFPQQLRAYDFSRKSGHDICCGLDANRSTLFYKLVDMKEAIWCIPYSANSIVYINKQTKKADIYDIPEEEESRESLINRELPHKYIFLYQRNQKCVGLFSLKQNAVIEIDTMTFQKRYINTTVEESVLRELYARSINTDTVMTEKKYSLEMLLRFIEDNANTQNREMQTNIGKQIHSYISKEQEIH